MNINEWTLVASIATAIITALALFFTVRSFKKQLQLQFFADYTKRYQEIMLNFPEQINEEKFSIESLTPEVKDKTLRYMRAYFDLCSEEYFLWKNKNLDNTTWKEWESGMRFAFSKPAFKQAWNILRLDTIYYGDFTSLVKSSISSELA
ncbi:hypothetical protein P8H27_18580 [Pseudomonas sp. sp1636]|uniref:hypothetical protein n=1 Tax=Pseudomonas sp. sp1636 TaxID=3036707 RepID=UPI0025A66A4F|nr:hypothetical protein [Pseudomonas sp. sp1636]MDM8350885.1 hypothetical protein [Pseudomonas sp. sp1636]